MLKDHEYALSLTGEGDSIYKSVDPKYKHIPLTIGLRLRMSNGATGHSQWIYLDQKQWRVQLTLVAPEDGRGQLEILAGTEPGGVTLRGLSLRKGCGEVAYRRFEHGLVLMNGSAIDACHFDLSSIDAPARYRRITGVVDPEWNNGQPENETIELPPREALFLMRVK